MTWQEKFAAINKLGEASLRMTVHGRWYVRQDGVSLLNDKREWHRPVNAGESPEEAVNDYWHQVAHPPDGYVVHWGSPVRPRDFLWNGNEWVEVKA